MSQGASQEDVALAEPVRQRLWPLVAGVLAAVALLVILSWGLQSHLQALARAKIEATLHGVLDSSHQALRSWSDEHRAAVGIWASSDDIRVTSEELLAVERSPEALLAAPAQQQLREWFPAIRNWSGYRGYFVIAPDNVNLASSRDGNVGAASLLTLQEGFLERLWSGDTAISAPQASDVPLTDAHGVLHAHWPTAFVGAPIRGRSDEVFALLLFRIDPTQDFTAILTESRVGETGETYAVDAHARLLNPSRFEHQLRDLGLLAEGQASVLNMEARVPGGALTRMAAHVTAGGSGADLDGYPDYRGVEVVGAWRWDDDLNMGLTAEQDVAEAYRDLDAARAALTAFTAVAVVLLLVLAVVFGWARARLVASAGQLRQTIVELRHARDLAEAASRAKSAFLANITHQIRTPLHAILGNAQALAERSPGPPHRELEAIDRSGHQLLGMVEDVMELASLQAGQTVLEPLRTDPSRLLRDVTERFAQRASGKGLMLDLHVGESVPKAAHLDEEKVKAVISHLLDNAVKFTDEGGIVVRAESRGGAPVVRLKIGVEDTGRGISEQDQGRVFDPFEQVTMGSEGEGGSGVGLAVSREYVRMMGGRLTVDSVVGHGTTFQMVLPAGVESGAVVGRDTLLPVGAAPAEEESVDGPTPAGAVPDELLGRLGEAAAGGYLQRLGALLTELEAHDPHLAAKLRARADDFDYDGMIDRLNSLSGEGGDDD